MRLLLCLLVLVPATLAIKCYVCNTATQTNCKSLNETDPATAGFKMDCPRKLIGKLTNVGAIGCRKVEQFIGDEYTLLRDCYYLGEPDAEPFSKTNRGSKGISRTSYMCSNEDFCNVAPSSLFAALSVSLPVLAVAFLH